jgi:chorismate mutase
VNSSEKIGEIREKMDKLTEELVELLSKRDKMVMRIGEEKKRLGLPVLDSAREKEVLERVEAAALKEGVDPAFVRELVLIIIRHGRQLQK